MSRAVVALRSLLPLIAKEVGLEGAFFTAGTAALAVAASFVSPAGPWFVVGVALVSVGVLYALPRRS